MKGTITREKFCRTSDSEEMAIDSYNL